MLDLTGPETKEQSQCGEESLLSWNSGLCTALLGDNTRSWDSGLCTALPGDNRRSWNSELSTALPGDNRRVAGLPGLLRSSPMVIIQGNKFFLIRIRTHYNQGAHCRYASISSCFLFCLCLCLILLFLLLLPPLHSSAILLHLHS